MKGARDGSGGLGGIGAAVVEVVEERLVVLLALPCTREWKADAPVEPTGRGAGLPASIDARGARGEGEAPMGVELSSWLPLRCRLRFTGAPEGCRESMEWRGERGGDGERLVAMRGNQLTAADEARSGAVSSGRCHPPRMSEWHIQRALHLCSAEVVPCDDNAVRRVECAQCSAVQCRSSRAAAECRRRWEGTKRSGEWRGRLGSSVGHACYPMSHGVEFAPMTARLCCEV